MEFEIKPWLDKLTGRLQKTFGKRLLYVGLGGSYARAEATPESDIDVNIVLDQLDGEDLVLYRGLVKSMPQSEKLCGFICGKKVMESWPRHELFQFMQGSIVLQGSLEDIISPPARADIRENILNTASLIYHESCHRFIFAGDPVKEVEELKPAYKLAFFVLQEFVYLTKSIYVPTKKELLGYMEGTNKAILETLINWESQKKARAENPGQYFFALVDWSGKMMVPENLPNR